MPPAWALRALLQDAGAAASSVFADGAGGSVGSSDPQQQEQWSSTHHKLGPSGATIGIVCAVIVVLLVVATLTHWLHRSGRLPCCSKLLDDSVDDEMPTFLQARHSLEVPPPAAADPPPVVVLMPDDEVEIAVKEQQKRAGQSQRDAAAAGAGSAPAAPFAHPPAFWVVDADQQQSQASDSPRSSDFQQSRRRADAQAVPLLHRPAPRAGMQRRAKAAPSDSFVYMI